MDILFLLVPMSVLLVFALMALFRWALGAGQFDDLEGPAHSVIMDDDTPHPPQDNPVDKDPPQA